MVDAVAVLAVVVEGAAVVVVAELVMTPVVAMLSHRRSLTAFISSRSTSMAPL